MEQGVKIRQKTGRRGESSQESRGERERAKARGGGAQEEKNRNTDQSQPAVPVSFHFFSPPCMPKPLIPQRATNTGSSTCVHVVGLLLSETFRLPIIYIYNQLTTKRLKAYHALDRESQLLLQALIILIRRQIQPIKARMAPRQPTRIAALLDREPARSIAALQILESVHGHARRARGKLQQPRLALRWP